MSKQTEPPEVPEELKDEQYLLDSILLVRNNLVRFRYDIKEIKICQNLAKEEKNALRFNQLTQEKALANERIKAALEDQKRIISLYKKIKKVDKK